MSTTRTSVGSRGIKFLNFSKKTRLVYSVYGCSTTIRLREYFSYSGSRVDTVFVLFYNYNYGNGIFFQPSTVRYFVSFSKIFVIGVSVFFFLFLALACHVCSLPCVLPQTQRQRTAMRIRTGSISSM